MLDLMDPIVVFSIVSSIVVGTWVAVALVRNGN